MPMGVFIFIYLFIEKRGGGMKLIDEFIEREDIKGEGRGRRER